MYLYFLFYTTMSECMIFYGPTVPEINYSSSSSSSSRPYCDIYNVRLVGPISYPVASEVLVVTGSKDFNSLPVNLKSIKEYKYFKRETKEHFRNLWCNEY